MRYKWLFFDADGTLFDYDLAEAHALEGTFRDFRLEYGPFAAGAYRQINAEIWLDFEAGRVSAETLRVLRFERLFAVVGMQTDINAFAARYLINLSRASELMPGAKETVLALRERYQLALITNGLKDVQRPRLALSSLNGLFDEVAISEEIGAAKPDPLYFERVFKRIGDPPKASVLVIGDSLTSDIQGGINYGLDTCWFNLAGKLPDPHYPVTYEIRRLMDLEPLLLTEPT